MMSKNQQESGSIKKLNGAEKFQAVIQSKR